MKLYIGKDKNTEITKIREKDLDKDLYLFILEDEVMKDEPLEISLYQYKKKELEMIFQKTITVNGKLIGYKLPKDFLGELEKGKYVFMVKRDQVTEMLNFEIVGSKLFLLILLPLLVGGIIAGGLLLGNDRPEGNNLPIETLRDVDGDVKSGTPIKTGLSEKEMLLNNIQSFSRFVISSAISTVNGKECYFEIQNPKRTTFASDKSAQEVNKILEGELTVYESDREGILEYDSVNIIQVSLQSKEGEEYYVSPAMSPDSYIDTITLNKEIPANEDTIIAVLKTFTPEGTYQNSFQFTIQVNH